MFKNDHAQYLFRKICDDLIKSVHITITILLEADSSITIKLVCLYVLIVCYDKRRTLVHVMFYAIYFI